MIKYLPFKIVKIQRPTRSGPDFKCKYCSYTSMVLKQVKLHQKQKCKQFLKHFPNAKEFQIENDYTVIDSDSQYEKRREEKKDSDFLQTKNQLPIIKVQKIGKFANIQKVKRYEEQKQVQVKKPQKSLLRLQPTSEKYVSKIKSQGNSIPCIQKIPYQLQHHILMINPSLYTSQQPEKYIRSPSELITKYSNCIFQSFSILSATKPSIFLEEFRQILEVYRFDRLPGVNLQNHYQSSQYKQRARNTLFSLFKLHFNDKKKFTIIIGSNKTLVINFSWRNDIPEIVMVGSMNTFGSEPIYKDLLRDSNSFKQGSEMCVEAIGEKQVLKIWRYVAAILDEFIPFTTISKHSFQGAFKYIPVVVDQIEQVKDKENILNSQAGYLFKLKIYGYVMPHSLHTFCLAIQQKMKCLVEANILEKSIVIQNLAKRRVQNKQFTK